VFLTRSFAGRRGAIPQSGVNGSDVVEAAGVKESGVAGIETEKKDERKSSVCSSWGVGGGKGDTNEKKSGDIGVGAACERDGSYSIL